jgi:hypothetical protein
MLILKRSASESSPAAEVSRGHSRWSGVVMPRPIEGPNVGIRRMIYNEFIAQAMTAETHKRTPGLSWRPEAENHVGGAEPGDAISRSKPCIKSFFR